jgi:hypothetical protein
MQSKMFLTEQLCLYPPSPMTSFSIMASTILRLAKRQFRPPLMQRIGLMQDIIGGHGNSPVPVVN